MPRIFLRKQLGALRPVDGRAQDALARIKDGETVAVEIRRPRRLRHHRWYWALVGLVHEAQELYATPDDLHAAIKCAIGYGRTVKLPDGRAFLVPGSIAFDSMDETAFQDFTDRVVRLVCERILPGITEDVLRAEVEALISGGRAA